MKKIKKKLNKSDLKYYNFFVKFPNYDFNTIFFGDSWSFLKKLHGIPINGVSEIYIYLKFPAIKNAAKISNIC